jgi:hypothetical protein
VPVLRDVCQPTDNFAGQEALRIVGPFHDELVEGTENQRDNGEIVGEVVEEEWRR